MGKSKLPALLATLVAVPIAIAAGIGAFKLIEPAEDPAAEADLSPVSVEVPELSDEDAVICLALTAKAPQSLGELPARPVEGGEHAAEFVLAYGDPAVVARCGAEAVEIDQTAPVFPMGGVCWYSEEDGDGTEWVTVDRRVPVGVTVPVEQEQAFDVLTELSATIGDAVPASEDGPTGCA